MTPAIQLLHTTRSRFTLHQYEHDPRAKSYGLEAAEALDLAPERVFKTLVVDAVGEMFVALVPVTGNLNMKQMAKAIKRKKVAMADPHKVQSVTGYIIGGVSPLGQKKALPTIVDQSALGFETIFVSAGKRGMDVELCPNDLVTLTRASISPHLSTTLTSR